MKRDWKRSANSKRFPNQKKQRVMFANNLLKVQSVRVTVGNTIH